MTFPCTMWCSLVSLALAFTISCGASDVPVEPTRPTDADSKEVTLRNADVGAAQDRDMRPGDAATLSDGPPLDAQNDSSPDRAAKEVTTKPETYPEISSDADGSHGTALDDTVLEDTVSDDKDDKVITQSPCPTILQENDFGLVLHRLNAEGELGPPLNPFESIEIVQGPQGGVHIEFGYRAAYSADLAPKVFAAFDGKTYMNYSEPAVGTGGTPLTVLFLSSSDNGYDSPLNLVIFEQNEASHYAEKPCCAVATVSILEPSTKNVVATSTSAVELYCVDIF